MLGCKNKEKRYGYELQNVQKWRLNPPGLCRRRFGDAGRHHGLRPRKQGSFKKDGGISRRFLRPRRLLAQLPFASDPSDHRHLVDIAYLQGLHESYEVFDAGFGYGEGDGVGRCLGKAR